MSEKTETIGVVLLPFTRGGQRYNLGREIRDWSLRDLESFAATGKIKLRKVKVKENADS